MPDAPGLELIAQEINEAHPGAVTETALEHGRATLIVKPDLVLGVLGWLRDTEGQGYRFLSSLHAADYLPATPRFAVHYELLCRDRVERINVKALLRDPAGGNGNDELPEIEFTEVDFNAQKFMTDLMNDKVAAGGKDEEERPGEWKEGEGASLFMKPSGYTGVTVCGSTGRSLGTVNTAVSWVRCTVSSTGVQRWLAPEVGVLPDTVSPVPSSSTPVAAFTNVQLPSPVVDMIH